MVEVIAPHRVQSTAAVSRHSGVARIVFVGLGDHVDRAPQFAGQRLHPLLDLREDVLRRIVFDGLHRIQPQAVEVILPNPVQRVLHYVAAHMFAARGVVVHRLSPRRFVVRREVRTEVAQVIAFRAEMVVNHIENHRQPAAMRGIDESFECLGATVAGLHGVGRHAVISPIAHARESRHRHHLDHRNPQLLQVFEPGNGAVERAFRRKSPNMQFVNDVIAERKPAPSFVAPVECRRINDLGRAVHTFGQKA